MNWNAIMGTASTFAFLFPVILIGMYKLYTQRAFQVLFLYYLLSAVYNLMVQDIIPVSIQTRKIFGTFSNYLDTPMMLLFLLSFCTDKWRIRTIQVTLGIFIVYEAIVTMVVGFTNESNVYILGPGISIILIFSLILFIRQMRITVVQGRSLGKTLMLTSIVFSYVLFGIIYLFHYVQKLPAVNDIFLLYFITSFITSVIMSIGIVLVNNRIREVKELQLTRKELQMFFNHPVAGVK
jgi:hypothetical protein